MSKDKDQPLITLVLAGDTNAYAKLVQRYQHMVYTLVLKLVGKPEDAQEIAQDTFLKAYQALPSFKGDSKFSTWLYKIAYYKGLDQLKKRKRVLEENTIDGNIPTDIRSIDNTWDLLEEKEQKETIKKAVNQLNADDSIVIMLFYFEELPLKEIAKILGLKSNAAKVKLFRARKRLAQILRKKLKPETIQAYEPCNGSPVD
jgi:RNA polymerase sigma-70 factor (ECF subfamily)